ncbi:hypothetical protein E2C01_024180 [Portunus trituberculatus]|uniref:Uncharacterized protein n=1 Tax=Portunus trituberculatus TaxID=210409 RepID=A0A5B7EBD9_PORTR|nr:hypothetical protein [Portunus trituberculatus]
MSLDLPASAWTLDTLLLSAAPPCPCPIPIALMNTPFPPAPFATPATPSLFLSPLPTFKE